MSYGAERLTDDQLRAALAQYEKKIPVLEAKILETNDLYEVETIAANIEHLQNKQAAVQDEMVLRGIV